MSRQTVVVAMSGGVDSSVAALLLKQQGYDLIGMFMKNWEEKDEEGRCLSAKEYEDAQRVCDHLQIPCYSVNFVKEYWDQVFTHFLKELELGLTPNPDILCNREIKFKALLEKALSIGGEYLATGHYCQIAMHEDRSALLKGTDPGKDQSYFLYAIEQSALKQVLFPVGSILKTEIRKIASSHKLATAEKKDSTGICFIGKRNFKQFLSGHLSFSPGVFKTLGGEVVGSHEGAGYYTIGQRKGMGIGGRGDAWFVVSKDMAQNVVYVVQGAEHPALFYDGLIATAIHWISGHPPLFPLQCMCKVRYRQSDQACQVNQVADGTLQVLFSNPQRAVTAGQSVVFYRGDECLGGAIIRDTWRNIN